VPQQVDRRTMERWLVDHGFTLEPGKKTSHRHFVGHGVKVTLPGHGPQDLTKKHVAIILRQLRAAGFDPRQVRDELAGAS
jgi:predicted RNA binding protein YcfA (HicA-like mRNA interferase family)